MKTVEKVNVIFLLIALFLSVGVFSCSDDEDEIRMWIASEKKMGMTPVGLEERLMFQYKLKESGDWMFLCESLAGFDYEEGYEYIILVKEKKIKNPVQDQSGINYSFIKVLSKTKVESAS